MTFNTQPYLFLKQWQQCVLAVHGLQSQHAESFILRTVTLKTDRIWGQDHRWDVPVGDGVFEVEYIPVATPNLMFLLHSISPHFRGHINMFLSTYCMPSIND